MKTTALKIIAFLTAFMLGLSVNAQVVYVDPGATGNGNGASWANAVTDIQAGIDLAATAATISNPIQVWVKSGTYTATSGTDRTTNFIIRNNVLLYGGFAGTETALSDRDIQANPTILSGDIGVQADITDNSYNPFQIEPSFNRVVFLDGFVIDSFYDPTNQGGSIGLVLGNTNAVMLAVQYQNCEFRNNEIGLGSVYGFSSTPTLFYSCKFFDNGGSNGATLWVSGGNLEVHNSLFVGNSGSVFHQSGFLKLANNTFTENIGNAVFLQNQPTPVTTEIFNNVFWNNPGTDIVVDGTASQNLTAGINLVEDPFAFGTTITEDPVFKNPSVDDFSITGCSPAIDQGDNTQIFNGIFTDLNGNNRFFNNGTIDLGAYEVSYSPLSFSAVEVGEVQCAGTSTGSINVNGGGGTGSPLEYSLDGVNFQSTGLFSNLSAGNYDVYIRDTGDNCSINQNYALTEPSAISFDFSVSTSPAMNVISVQATGGESPYTYSLDGINYSSNDLTLGNTGSYTIYVRDLGGCVATKTVYLTSEGNQVVFLDPGATGDGSGNSWINAFTDLQSAIDAAGMTSSNDFPTEVWVKAGTYYPDIQSSTDRTKTIFMKDNVYLIGGFAGTETESTQRNVKANLTILSGDIGVASDSTDNSYGMLTVGSDVANKAKIDGWILKGAFSLAVEPTNGAIHLTGNVGEFHIANCDFQYNLSNQGACVRMFEVTNTTSEVFIETSAFYNNGFFTNTTYVGSAISVKNNTSIYNSIFLDNKSGVGGVFYTTPQGANLTVINSTFYENRAGTSGSVLFDGSSGSTNMVWHNNINWGDVGQGNALNLFTGAGSTFFGRNNISTQVLGAPTDNNVIFDPLFVDAANYDLRLSQCSPGVNAGDDSFLPMGAALDFDGNPRQFNTVDIGAYELQVNPFEVVSVDVDSTTCSSLTDGVITVVATSPFTPVEYSIDGTNFQTSGVFTDLAPNTYVVTIRDSNGCQTTRQLEVQAPNPISFSFTTADPSCFGGSDGQISIAAGGGTGVFEFTIDDGVTWSASQDFMNLLDGTYDVGVRDANLCEATFQQATLNQPTAITATATITNVLCNGGSNGTISLVTSGGTAPYEYSLDGVNFQTGNEFLGLPADTYSITIKDTNDCLLMINETVSEPSPLSTIAINATQVSCNGESDASFNFEGTGGTLPYQYSLDGTNFQSSSLWENQSVGSYTITILDANNCITTTNWNVTEPDVLTASASSTGTSSCGLSDGEVIVSPSGGTSPFQYSIDGGTTFQPSNTFTGLNAGAYTITVVDDNGCEVEANASVDDPVTATFSIEKTDVLCNGDASANIMVNVSGGATPISYTLNGGVQQSSNVFDGLLAGTYNIEIVEGNGCTQSTSVTISEPDAITATSIITDLTCNGDGSGVIEINALGGTSPYEYSIDGMSFQTSNAFGSLAAGMYSIDIRDANNCNISISAEVMEPTPIVVALDSFSDPTCIGVNDGELNAEASGGTAPYEYSIDGVNFSSSPVFSDLSAGTYTITVRDDSGCQADVTQVLTNEFSLSATANIIDPLCNGDSNGEVTVSATGGIAPYEYTISGSSTPQSSSVFSDLQDGTYTIFAIDANGCMASVVVTLSEPDILSSQSTVSDITCNGETDGMITIAAAGGTTPYEYSIDGVNFQASSEFSSLSDGTYTITVRDDNGCETTEVVSLTEPDLLSATVTQNDRKDFTVSASGGTSPYEFSADGTNFQSSGTFTGLNPGNYVFTVRDNNGCTVRSESFDVVLSVSNPEVSIYPNPAAEYINIDGLDYDTASILDLNGKEIIQSSSKRISVLLLNSGIHFINLYKGGKLIHQQKLRIN